MDRVDAPEVETKPRLRLPPAPSAVHDVASLRKATFGWDGVPVLSDVELHLERGMRLAILGPNGAGKSTLLHALTQKIPLLKGQRRIGQDIRIGVFTQDLAQDLPADGLPLDVVLARAPRALPAQARAALGALGLTGAAALRPIGSLSGGEKARVALACFAVQEHDLLLLDEPTNHLDAVTVDVLVEALAAFDGTLVVVTHDRFLVERVATHVAHINGGTMTLHPEVRPDDFEPVLLLRPGEVAEVAPVGAEDHAARKKRIRELERMKKRIEQIGGDIEAVEKKIAKIDDEMVEVATNYPAVSKLAAERDALSEKLDGYFAEWERLERDIAAG